MARLAQLPQPPAAPHHQTMRPLTHAAAAAALLALAPACREIEAPPRPCDDNTGCARQICLDGACASVACDTASDCPSGTCDLRTCVPIACERDGDCGGGGLVCVLGVCQPPDGGYVPPPPRPEAGVIDLGPGDPEPGSDARIRDLGPPADQGPAPDAGADPLLGRYALTLSFADGDCPDPLNGQADDLLVLNLNTRAPLTGDVEGVIRDAVPVSGETDGINLSLATDAPARIDELCVLDLGLSLTAITTPGGGLVGDLTWTITPVEPCEPLALLSPCTRRDTVTGARQAP